MQRILWFIVLVDLSLSLQTSKTGLSRNCLPGDFECGDGFCIPANWACDGRVDCPRGDDEYSAGCNTAENSKSTYLTEKTELSNCGRDFFGCSNGHCIPARWKCDEVVDCPDKDDEKDCTNDAVQKIRRHALKDSECPLHYFMCLSEDCIPNDWVCDGHQDCSTGEDESDCDKDTQEEQETKFLSCPEPYFKCSSSECIPNSCLCDNHEDCLGGDDEKNCSENPIEQTTISPPVVCLNGSYLCSSGECIPSVLVCDGRKDCPEGDDEATCSISSGKIFTELSSNIHLCSDQFYRCSSGDCIPSQWVCDGDKDCQNGGDETGCHGSTEIPNAVQTISSKCGDDFFECTSGECIPNNWVCDSSEDCPSGDDEESCGATTDEFTPSTTSTSSPTCSDDNFSCSSGDCIPNNWVCDNSEDCPSGDDEESCGATTDEVTAYRSTNSPICSDDNFSCSSGDCIPNNLVCDTNEDCPAGDDEESCETATDDVTTFIPTNSPACSDDHFSCSSGDCIPNNWVCDNSEDCPSGDDEESCGVTTGEVTTPPSTNSPTCSDDNFSCSSGDCIPNNWVCDGYEDCPEHDDEEDCESVTNLRRTVSNNVPTCANNQFSCKSGECIPSNWACDGSKDCPQGDDEKECLTKNSDERTTTVEPTPSVKQSIFIPCSPDEFQCSLGLCIPNKWVCNGRRDCPLVNDELGCPTSEQDMEANTCPEGMYKCASSSCIPNAYLCDGENDCLLSDDEENCFVHEVDEETGKIAYSFHCSNGQFECVSGKCIDIDEVCDGVNNCPGNDDELKCKSDECSESEFSCALGNCIPHDWVCDGVSDCKGSDDENGCRPPAEKAVDRHCHVREFQCTSGRCLPLGYVCDGINDCPDGEDENECPTSSKPFRRNEKCPEDTFQCFEGPCISMDEVCDGNFNCPHGEDEKPFMC